MDTKEDSEPNKSNAKTEVYTYEVDINKKFFNNAQRKPLLPQHGPHITKTSDSKDEKLVRQFNAQGSGREPPRKRKINNSNDNEITTISESKHKKHKNIDLKGKQEPDHSQDSTTLTTGSHVSLSLLLPSISDLKRTSKSLVRTDPFVGLCVSQHNETDLRRKQMLSPLSWRRKRSFLFAEMTSPSHELSSQAQFHTNPNTNIDLNPPTDFGDSKNISLDATVNFGSTPHNLNAKNTNANNNAVNQRDSTMLKSQPESPNTWSSSSNSMMMSPPSNAAPANASAFPLNESSGAITSESSSSNSGEQTSVSQVIAIVNEPFSNLNPLLLQEKPRRGRPPKRGRGRPPKYLTQTADSLLTFDGIGSLSGPSLAQALAEFEMELNRGTLRGVQNPTRLLFESITSLSSDMSLRKNEIRFVGKKLKPLYRLIEQYKNINFDEDDVISAGNANTSDTLRPPDSNSNYLSSTTSTSDLLAHYLALQMVDIAESKKFSRHLMDLIHDDFLSLQMLLNSRNRDLLAQIDRIRHKLVHDIQEVRFKLFSDASSVQHVTTARLDELREELATEISRKENTILSTLKRIRTESEQYLNQAKFNEQKELRERELRKLHPLQTLSQFHQLHPQQKATTGPFTSQTNVKSPAANWGSVTSLVLNSSAPTKATTITPQLTTKSQNPSSPHCAPFPMSSQRSSSLPSQPSGTLVSTLQAQNISGANITVPHLTTQQSSAMPPSICANSQQESSIKTVRTTGTPSTSMEKLTQNENSEWEETLEEGTVGFVNQEPVVRREQSFSTQ